MSKIPVGLQMYTVRDVCEKDFIGALRQVADIGYAGIELAGTYGLSASELRDVLNELNLKCPGNHTGERDVDKLVAFNQTIGCTYIGGPALPPGGFPKDEASCLAAAKHMNEVGAAYKARGLHLYYHNHAHEFEQVNGKYILDIFYENTHPDLVYAEIDVFWVQYANVDPAAYLRKYPGRCPLVHIKDMDAGGGMVDLGKGVIPWHELLDAAATAGVTHWFAEHDEPVDPMAFAKSAVTYLQALS